jgi:hypothetical protein
MIVFAASGSRQSAVSFRFISLFFEDAATILLHRRATP